MRLASWFALFALCSLSACRSGPRITLCIIGGSNAPITCVDADEKERTIPLSCEKDAQGRSTIPEIAQFENWACVSPDDLAKILRACKQESGK